MFACDVLELVDVVELDVPELLVGVDEANLPTHRTESRDRCVANVEQRRAAIVPLATSLISPEVAGAYHESRYLDIGYSIVVGEPPAQLAVADGKHGARAQIFVTHDVVNLVSIGSGKKTPELLRQFNEPA